MFEIKVPEKITIHILPFSETHAVYEIMSKNVVEPKRP
jgi:hypothetical protein